MRLEELKSLNEDELALLWYAINKTTPPVLAGVELEPSVFCAIKPHAICNRVDLIQIAIKDEYKPIYNSLRQKLNMPPILNQEISSTVSSSVQSTSEPSAV